MEPNRGGREEFDCYIYHSQGDGRWLSFFKRRKKRKKQGKKEKSRRRGGAPSPESETPLGHPPDYWNITWSAPHYNLTESHRHKRPRSLEKVTLGAVKCYWASIFLVIV